MTIAELHDKLQKDGVPADHYFLHGLFGSADDNKKIALAIRIEPAGIDYEIYYRKRGEKNTISVFATESEACDFMYRTVVDEQTFWRVQSIEGLGGMTVNERLWVSGLVEEFDRAQAFDKTKAKQILRWLRVDEASIEQMVL